MVARSPPLSRKPPPLSTRAQVREVLRELLPAGDCSVEAVAKRFSIDRRSILRRLRSEGTTYSDLLKQVRNDLLDHYIKNTDLSLTEIGSLLGFSSVSALSRWRRNEHRRSRPIDFNLFNETLWMEDDEYVDIIHIPKPTRKPRK
jgi:AraC-like DNA-binding protein